MFVSEVLAEANNPVGILIMTSVQSGLVGGGALWDRSALDYILAASLHFYGSGWGSPAASHQV
jgi:hypothetical protein